MRSGYDVVTQLAAVTHALNGAGYVVIAHAMQDCLTDPAGAEARDGLAIEELEKLFLSLA